jgi:sugar phosphate isomerase/epimerase
MAADPGRIPGTGRQVRLEVHPPEIAYDIITMQRALEAVGGASAFGVNFDPSHLVHQFVDPVAFLEAFPDRIFHVHVKDSRLNLTWSQQHPSSHLSFGDARRGWDFVSPGHGDVKFDPIIRALNRIGYGGPLSVEWEDSGMNREFGAQEALQMVRRLNFSPSDVAFDAAFSKH